MAKKLSQFSQKYRLLNSVTACFNITMVQMTEMSQRKTATKFNHMHISVNLLYIGKNF